MTPTEALLDQLRKLTSRWTYDKDVPKAQRMKCAEIGKKLNALGGFNLMTEAYYHATRHNAAASTIRALWHGIGDWQM